MRKTTVETTATKTTAGKTRRTAVTMNTIMSRRGVYLYLYLYLSDRYLYLCVQNESLYTFVFVRRLWLPVWLRAGWGWGQLWWLLWIRDEVKTNKNIKIRIRDKVKLKALTFTVRTYFLPFRVQSRAFIPLLIPMFLCLTDIPNKCPTLFFKEKKYKKKIDF